MRLPTSQRCKISAILPADHGERLHHARISLEGLSVGDAFGELHGYRGVPLVRGTWYYTDDTNMALSIYQVLREHGEIDQEALAARFAQHFEQERGYGMGAQLLLKSLRKGNPWRAVSKQLFSGQGSFGNGSAMRVAPVGAYFAGDLSRVAEQARRSAEVTHMHSEGAAGGIGVAAAAGLAWSLRGGEPLSRADFIERVLSYIPESDVRDGVVRARDLPAETNIYEAVRTLGNGGHVSCQDTVPFVLWCAGEHLSSYEDALWLCASGGGDRDTTCAMVGGIVACFTGIEGIPAEWIKRREVLPKWALGEEG